MTNPNAYTDEEVVAIWRDRIVSKSESLDGEHDKGGHDWYSLWVGFILGLSSRDDLANDEAYMRLGFPVEMETPR